MGKDVFCYSQSPTAFYFVPPRREDKIALLIFIHLALGKIKICSSNFTKWAQKTNLKYVLLLQLFHQLQCSRKLNPVCLFFFWRRVLFPQNKECGKGGEDRKCPAAERGGNAVSGETFFFGGGRRNAVFWGVESG